MTQSVASLAGLLRDAWDEQYQVEMRARRLAVLSMPIDYERKVESVKARYVQGLIELDEFERVVGSLLRAEDRQL